MDESPDKPRLKQQIFDFFPTLDRIERKELVGRITLGADGGVDFIVMMLLAATLASLGLLQGSTAVVIGAMLVAPLMGPLVGAGLALAQGNLKLFRSALWVSGSGILIGLAASLFFGALNPGFEPSMEIEARGNPDVLDLVIAFASGMVAAYAMGRPNVSGTLAGVAIAAALLPPLAVVGIGLTNSQPLIAGYAAILFATNLVAIILGATLIFRLLGMRSTQSKTVIPIWVFRTTVLFAVIVMILAAPLLMNVLEKSRVGQVKPVKYPVSAVVRNAVRLYISQHPALKVLIIGRDSVEPDTGILLVMSAAGPLGPGVHDELVQLIRTARGDEDVNVEVFTLLEAPTVEPDVSSD